MINEFYQKMYAGISECKGNAYIHYDEVYTYAELCESMLKMNSILSEYHNSRVVIFAEKCFLNYCAILSVIFSKNTWVPMNPNIPSARNLEMIKLADASLIITDRNLPESIKNYINSTKIRVITLKDMVSGNISFPYNLDEFNKDDFSMIYFTSGSTGIPKGVPITHENYITNIYNILNLIPIREGEVFADYHDLAFVISVPIIFPCIMRKGSIAPAVDKQDMFMPVKNIQKNHVSVLITVPSTMARIRQMNRTGLAGLQFNVIVLCGEPLHLDILQYCLEKTDTNNIYNFYGSTEVAPWTFFHRCEQSDLDRFKKYGYVPIGKPIDGNEIKIENEELLVSSAQITPGYLGGISKDKFPIIDNKRWYCTGDKVILDEDGYYICKGRLDSLVKIGGYRIELADTESHLRGLSEVEAAVCFVVGNDDRQFIVAVLHTKREVELKEVRAFLSERLPNYMIPRKVITLESPPLNKSGKIDRLAIRNLYDG